MKRMNLLQIIIFILSDISLEFSQSPETTSFDATYSPKYLHPDLKLERSIYYAITLYHTKQNRSCSSLEIFTLRCVFGYSQHQFWKVYYANASLVYQSNADNAFQFHRTGRSRWNIHHSPKRLQRGRAREGERERRGDERGKENSNEQAAINCVRSPRVEVESSTEQRFARRWYNETGFFHSTNGAGKVFPTLGEILASSCGRPLNNFRVARTSWSKFLMLRRISLKWITCAQSFVFIENSRHPLASRYFFSKHGRLTICVPVVLLGNRYFIFSNTLLYRF